MASPEDKATSLKTKTELVRRTFNYSESETVIQDYSCSLKRMLLIPGRLYVTANFVSFIPVLGESNESLSFRKITEIKKDSTIMFSDAITFVAGGHIVSFGSLIHRDETFNLIYHLWKNPPLFYDPNDAEEESMRSFQQSISGKSGSRTSGGGNGQQGQQQQQVQYTKVDTESTRTALRLAMETKDTGIATMNEMSMQAEMIDNIERNVEHIHSNLDKSERLLKGIESFGGAMAMSMSKEKSSPDTHNQPQLDRTLQMRRREEPATEIDILEKLPNDSLQAGYLQFGADRFVVLDTNRKPTPTGTYTYDQIECFVVRARHHHLDVRFLNKTRFRLCSSYIQNVVNEFVLRSNCKLGRSAKVMFEPGVKTFAYGNPTIRFIPSSGRQNQAPVFGRASTMGLSNVIKNAPEGVKDALIQQDKDLDEISALLGDIHGIARTIGDEADRQSEQLDRVTTRVDHANGRLIDNNKRITKML
eukprot:gene13382-15741_t